MPPRDPLACDASIDSRTLDRFRDAHADMFANLLATYLAQMPLQVDEIVAAHARSDVAGVSAAAHALKSSSAYLGANRLADLCRTLENRLRSGQRTDAHDFVSLVADIGHEKIRVVEALVRYSPQGEVTAEEGANVRQGDRLAG